MGVVEGEGVVVRNLMGMEGNDFGGLGGEIRGEEVGEMMGEKVIKCKRGGEGVGKGVWGRGGVMWGLWKWGMLWGGL